MEIPDSARLKFHFMTDADAERFYQLDSDPEVMRYITGRAMTREDIAAWYIPRLRQYADQNRGWGLWGMTTLEDHRYIGWILVRPMHFFEPELRTDDNLEVGWRLFRADWGQGYATEGATAVMQALQTNRLCTHFSATALRDNTASINVMQKLGMTFVTEEIYKDANLGEQLCVVYSRAAKF